MYLSTIGRWYYVKILFDGYINDDNIHVHGNQHLRYYYSKIVHNRIKVVHIIKWKYKFYCRFFPVKSDNEVHSMFNSPKKKIHNTILKWRWRIQYTISSDTKMVIKHEFVSCKRNNVINYMFELLIKIFQLNCFLWKE